MKNIEYQIIRYKIMDQHRALVRVGAYGVAWFIFRLLREGRVRLGLWDDAWEAEQTLIAAGLRPSYTRNGNSAWFYLRKAA